MNTATRLWAGRSGVRIRAGERDCSLLQTGYLAYPASCSVGTEFFFLQGLKRPGREVDHSHLAPTSRMNGAVLLLFQYAFMV